MPVELLAGEHPGDLEQRERVPRRGLQHAARDGLRHRHLAARLQQLGRSVGGQRAELDRLDVLARVAVRPLAEQDGDAPVGQPPCGEPQRVERRLVEPLRVVHQAHDGPLLGGQREQPEQRRADREPRLRRDRLERQRAGQRRGLRLRQPGAQGEHRRAQLRERRERHPDLRLDAARPQHRHALGGLDRGLQQRRLAHPGLASHHEHLAPAAARGLQRAQQASELLVATDQHGSEPPIRRLDSVRAACPRSSLCPATGSVPRCSPPRSRCSPTSLPTSCTRST